MEKHFKEILADIDNGEHTKTGTIGLVDYYVLSKTPYSFHFYATYTKENGKRVLTEMLYDLRYKKYFLKRNGREIKFSVDNLDTVVPRPKDGWYTHKFYTKENAKLFFSMVSVEENKGMYEMMMKAVGSIGMETVSMSSRALIRLIRDYNKLELLYKAGLDIEYISSFSTILSDVYIASRKDTKKVHQVLNLTKFQFNFLKEQTEDTRNIYKHVESARSLDQKDINRYRSIIQHIKDLEEQYNLEGRLRVFQNNYGGLGSYLDAVRWAKNRNVSINQDNVYKFIFEYNHSNPRKLLEYLLFECYLSQGMEYHTAIREYRDYYRMCMDMEYTRFDKYPKYLKTYHDIVARNYKVVADEITVRNFTKRVEQYKMLEGPIGKKFVMVVPNDPQDLVTEGNVLGHCVASYVKNVAAGNTSILFFRKKEEPETPYITVEVRDGKIVQFRGRGNRLPADRLEAEEVKQAVRSYAKKRELGVTSYA